MTADQAEPYHPTFHGIEQFAGEVVHPQFWPESFDHTGKRIVVIGSFVGMGFYALAAPAALVRPFGITLEQPTSRSEVRAVYGGFGLAIAGVLAYAALQPSERTGILMTVGAALAGMAFGRIVSAVVDARTPFYPNWFYCLVEIIAAAALSAIAFS